MRYFRWNDIAWEQLSPVFARRVMHGESMTVARIEMKAGCSVPEHSHVNEQLSTIESGCLRFTLGGKTIDVHAGESILIPPHLPHSAVALENTVAQDIFVPVREDWVRGDDAYLRGSAEPPK